MNKKMVLNAFLGIFLLCSIYAERIINGAEIIHIDEKCNKLCTTYGKDNYGNVIASRIPSILSEPQETYPGSKKFVCIPCECGDGVLDENEICDDSNNDSLDGCTADCGTIEFCGDQLINTPDEDCDQGYQNGKSGSLCSNECKVDICLGTPEDIKFQCGNGTKECDEECDAGDNNGKPGSECSDDCIIDKCLAPPIKLKLLCGNGVKECKEECDAGPLNGKPGSKCSSECIIDLCIDKPENIKLLCGNGVKDCDEECDLGTNNGLPGKQCTAECKLPVCGNGVKEGAETCDAGANNGKSGSGCANTCTVDKCLDTPEIKAQLCGNGTKDCDEECDDGNKVDGDGCSKECKPENECVVPVCRVTANVKGVQDTDITLTNFSEGSSCKVAAIVPQAGQQSSPDVVAEGGESKNTWVQASPWPFQMDTVIVCPAGTEKQNCAFASGTGPLGVMTCSCVKKTKVSGACPAFCGDGVKAESEECDDGNKADGDECSSSCKNTPCLYEVNYDGYTRSSDGIQTGVFQAENFDLGKLSCLSQIWGSLGNTARSSSGWTNFLQYDDRVWGQLLAWMTRELPGFDTTNASGATSDSWNDIYFDKDCKPMFTTQPSNVCGQLHIGYMPSPVSLLWNDKADLNKEWNLTKFKLNPFADEQTVIWKASSDAPLLVWDPKHTGVVKDGTQLFGNYTFGKNSFEKVSIKRDRNSADWIWNNGYEAMAKLDLNSDGELTGEELKELSLWFDENRNAVSEKGEVKSVIDMGITSLKVKPDGKTKSGDIYAVSGFTRLGKQGYERGFTVDWFTKTNVDTNNLLGSIKSTESQKVSEEILASKNSNKYEGVWFWKSDADAKKLPASGVLAFMEVDGKLKGNSLVELPLNENAENIKGILKKFSLEANVKKVKKTEVLSFELDINGSKTISEASLSADGKTLTGTSTTNVANPDASKGFSVLKYSWTAQKAESPVSK